MTDDVADEIRSWRSSARQLRELGAFEKDPTVAGELLERAKLLEAKVADAEERVEPRVVLSDV